MNKPLRFAFIGCGQRAAHHVAAVKADSRCQVVALADVNPASAESLNSEAAFGAAIYSDHKAMLATEKPDVVISCLWTPLHLPVFKDCVEAGVKAVLSEKPMAPTWGECLELARIAQESKVLLTFCHQRRFAPGNQYVRKELAAGRIGKITRLELTAPPNLLDCGTHTLDQALSFLGEVSPKWVIGAVDTSVIHRWFNVPAESMAVGTIVFPGEIRATFQVGGTDLDIWGGVRVTGTDGFIEVLWDGKIERAVQYSDPTWQPPTFDSPPDDQMLGVISNAIDCLESGEEPELSYQKALRASEIIFAIYESVRRNTRVELPVTGFTDSPFITMLDAGHFQRAVSSS